MVFQADNGEEFQSTELDEFACQYGFKIKFGHSHSPW